MGSSTLARVKAYVIVTGLERSLAENIVRNFDLDRLDFLTEDEQSKGLQRLREDQADASIELADPGVEDLLPYLDIGDLVNLLNRHARDARNILPEHITAATKLISKFEALTIRKRVMHSVRPLEVDDFPKLMKLASEIRKAAPSLAWAPLAINLRRLSRESSLLDISIPSFWTEEAPIIHNLPAAEFDDTGFIGRTKERKELRKLIEADYRVITVVGGAGIGKTALSLRVCNDLLEDAKPIFERIVWVTLKTRYLTAEGVREVNEAIDSLGALIDSILKSLHVTTQATWDTVLSQLKASRILLVIDNLETLGEEARELALNIPTNSKVLFTSRVGLGEIEIRYPLERFAPKDALALFRSLVTIHNCSPLKPLSQETTNRYASILDYNPLLIKWFVLAVSKGADAGVLLSKESLAEPLSFFYDKVYEKLDKPTRQILSVLLASRRGLTRTQLQDLVAMQPVAFAQAIQDLVRTSMVQRASAPDGLVVFQISQLVYEYLSQKYPPDDPTVRMVRERIRAWQTEQEKSVVQTARYRYGPLSLHVDKADERIAAQHLVRALKAISVKDIETANAALVIAEQLTPTWWEVYRVKARLFEAQNKPIYEVEETFEHSIRLNDNDVSRYYYATYLMKQNEYERALEQIEKGAAHDEALPMTFRSLKGLTLMRMGRIPEAIIELEKVWANRSRSLPANVGLAQGTQLAEAHRRQAEEMLSLGNHREVIDSSVKAARTVAEAIRDYGHDRILVETAVNILGPIARHVDQVSIDGQTLREIAQKWDASAKFRKYAVEFGRTVRHFQKNPDLGKLFPSISSELLSLGFVKQYTGQQYMGKIHFVASQSLYGFINCNDLGSVHFARTSLVDQSMWPALKAGDGVVFEVVTPRQKDKRPHAVNLKPDTAPGSSK